jgi:OPA family glycerol-3-phosphate transporter-like MFS transporter
MTLPPPRSLPGDARALDAGPAPKNIFLLGGIVFLMVMSVIGTHGLLTGAASMDFGGTRGAATSVAYIDAMVCLGIAAESFLVSRLASTDWLYWPLSMVPFALIGLLLCLRIWSALPNRET